MNIQINHSHRKYVLLLVSILLNGCVTTHYGNFIQNPSQEANQIMATDAVTQIVRLYPAASTQFSIGHAVNDAFGQTLIEKLRVSGFAVQEMPETSIEQSLLAVPQSSAELQAGIRLSYIVDQMEHIYHANIQIGDRHLSRAFILKDNGLYPAGHWLSRQ